MPKYLITNRIPITYTASADDAALWDAWFEQLGSSIVDRGNPVFNRRTLGHCGTDTLLGGYSLITAADLDAAVTLAKGSPTLASGGGVEVGELTLLN
jgi:hypothetical protein